MPSKARPPAEASVENAEELYVEVVNADDDPEGDAISQELSELKNRAKKLAEDLKMLSISAEIASDAGSTLSDADVPFEELMKRVSHFTETVDPIGDEDTKKEISPLKEDGRPLNAGTKLNAKSLTEVLPESSDPALVSKSTRKFPLPIFPDLSLEGERLMRRRKGGPLYWQMPFRHRLFQAERLNDPFRYAPTGDVYSYFQRRRFDPQPFTRPLPYKTTQALGGRV